MELNNLTGRSGSKKAVVRLNQCGLRQLRRIGVLLGHKVTGISLTAINVTAEARTKSRGGLCEIIVKTAGVGQAVLSTSC